jgi:hypothetical protein
LNDPGNRALSGVPETLSSRHFHEDKKAMANKPEYVDLISEATRQNRRRAAPLRIVAKPVVEESSRLSRWPPAMFRQWKLDNLMRWKPASWKLRDWL